MNGSPSNSECRAALERLEQELADLRSAYEQAREGERKFRRMAENTSEYLFCHDLDGNLTDVNTAIQRVGGYTEEELLGMKVQDLMPPRSRGGFEDYSERVRAQGRDEGVLQVVGKDGTTRTIAYRNSLLTDASTGACLVQGIARDITDRLEAERTLKVSEERYRTILDSIEEGYYEVDTAGNLTFFNESMSRILGYSPDELMGMNNRCYMPEEDAKKVFKAFNRVYRTGQPDRGVDWTLIRKDGSSVCIEMSVSLIRDAEDRPIGFRGIFRDITGRKRIEEELRRHRDHLEELVEERAREVLLANEQLKQGIEERRRSEEVYRSLLHSSADAIVLYDLEGCVQYVSPSFTRTFGWELHEVKGSVMPFVPEGEQQRTMAIVRIIKDTGRSFQGFETKRLTKDGTVLDVSISTSRYNDHEGRPAGLLVVLRDITETRRLQAQLQHAQKMESIGTIASGVAHNFRNILAGISVNTQLLQMNHGEDASLVDIAGRLGGYVKRGSLLVEGLMQFARKSRDEGFRVVDLVVILKATHELIRQSFERKIEIRADFPETLPILGDDPALRHVFMNLCTNARDAMPEGGVLDIRARKEGGQVEVAVSDNGVGMDSETQKKCIDPFFTTKEVNAGTGLGLSTSYGIVKNHGGDVYIQSAPGKGSLFRVVLPLAMAESKEVMDSREEEIAVRGGGRRVLIVDDEESILRALQEFLVSLGFETVAARDGREAVAAFRNSRPHVVIMDRNMPGMDGAACMRRILGLDAKARIILVSGYDQDGACGVDSDTRRAMAGYLTKPVDMTELSRLLERILGTQG